MSKEKNYIIKNIKTYSRVRKYLTLLCFILIFTGLLSFFIFGFYANNNAVKFIAKYKDKKNITIEKVMTNPRIKFEYSKNDYYDVKAKKAVHKNEEDMLLFDVLADGFAANIKSEKLLITNNGNNLRFTGNPVLIIKQKPKTKK